MQSRQTGINSDIAALKQILASTDYMALKHADGVLSAEEYEETRQYRQSLRDQINELEAELAVAVAEEGEMADGE